MVTRKEFEASAHSWVESFGMKLLARFIMPILISIIGYLIANTLTGINESIKELKAQQSNSVTGLWAAQRATTQALSATTSKLEVLFERVDQTKTRMDETDKRHSDSIDNITRRLDNLVGSKG